MQQRRPLLVVVVIAIRQNVVFIIIVFGQQPDSVVCCGGGRTAGRHGRRCARLHQAEGLDPKVRGHLSDHAHAVVQVPQRYKR